MAQLSGHGGGSGGGGLPRGKVEKKKLQMVASDGICGIKDIDL